MDVILLDDHLGAIVRATRCDGAHARTVILAVVRLKVGDLTLDYCAACATAVTRAVAALRVPMTATAIPHHPLVAARD